MIPSVLLDEAELRKKLEPYKSIAPFLLDLFTWRQPYHPVLIGGSISLLFFSIYYYDPPFITFLSLLALLLILIDLVAPLLTGFIGGGRSSNASTESEQKYNILVNRITYYSVIVWNGSVTLQEWRVQNPNWYSAGLMTTLAATAWIGASANNLFLAYLVVLFLGLLPGLLHRRVLEEYGGKFIMQVASTFSSGQGEKKRE